MKHLITYSLVFVGSMALSAVGGYLLVPAKHAQKPVQEKVTPTPGSTIVVEPTDEDEDEPFIPKESTPVDYLIDGLLNMKSLDISGDISITAFDYNFNLTNIEAYLTLETFTNIEASVNAEIEFRGQSTPISISYVGGTIYCSLLGSDIKMATSDFGDITKLIDSFGISIETPEMFNNIDLDTIMEDMASMKYSPLVEGGYEFNLSLFGMNIYLTCDNEYSLNSAQISGSLEGIDLAVDIDTTLHQSIENAIEIPETEDKPYQQFNDFIPFVEDFVRLAGEKQFGIELSASLKNTGDEFATTLNGDLQFNLDDMSGEGNLKIVEMNDRTYCTPQEEIFPTHDITLNFENDEMKFKYNEGLYGKFNLQTIKDLIDLVTTFLNSDNPINLLLSSKLEMPDLANTIIGRLINGEYELLFNDYITKLYADDEVLDIAISKDLIGIDSDIEIIIGLDANKHIQSLSIPTVSIMGMEIQLDANFKEYNFDYPLLPDDNSAKYFDFSQIKFLLSIGLDTATISNFHLKGKLQIPMSLIGLDLSGLVKPLSIDMQIFNDMSDISTRVIATLDNIPSIPIVNKDLFSSEDHKKLQLVYDNEFIYMTRYDIGAFLNPTKVVNTVSTKVSPDELLQDMNILKYLIGFGMGMSDTIMKPLMDAFTQPTERTVPLDYSKILNEYTYETNTAITRYDDKAQQYAHKWYLNVNIAELANNKDLESLTAAIYAGPYGNLEGEFLQYIDADFNINAANIFKCAVDLQAELTDIDPSITPSVFQYMQPYQELLAYVEAHANDKPLTFNY